MNLKKLPDAELLRQTHSLCALERKTTLEILHHLREIEARALFARTHSSLFEFCVKALGFSEDQASRRISAMRLLREVPEVEAQVERGELKLSQLAQVRSLVRTEKKETGRVVPKAEVAALLTAVAGKSTRETERALLAHSPTLQEKRRTEERVRVITPELTSITLTADAELTALLEEAKLLLSHNGNPNPGVAEVMKRALVTWVAQAKKKRGDGGRSPSPKETPQKIPTNTRLLTPASHATARGAVQPQTRTRVLPAALRRAVFERAQGQCEFVLSGSNTVHQRCPSRHALEVHHCEPYAHGGTHAPENLQLRCRTHNAAQARWDFG
jgi:5-methylcytosine-specific restriction endonuclease McrA